MISLLLSKVRDGGKNLPKYASTSSSQVSTEPYGNDSYHVVVTSLEENGRDAPLSPLPSYHSASLYLPF